MNDAVDWLRAFRDKLSVRFNSKGDWHEEELQEIIYEIYVEVLKEMVHSDD